MITITMVGDMVCGLATRSIEMLFSPAPTYCFQLMLISLGDRSKKNN